MCVGHVSHIDDGSSDALYRQIVELGDFLRRDVEIDDIFEVADLLRAGGGDKILLGERGAHVLSREAVAAQPGRVDLHLHLAHFAAIG